MDNNELNNNVLGDQILMGDTEPMPNLQPEQPKNNLNMNQGLNTVIQNNLNQNKPVEPVAPQQPTPVEPQIQTPVQPVIEPAPQQPVQPIEPQVTNNETDSIFSDMPASAQLQQAQTEEVKEEPTIPTEAPTKKKGKGPVILIILLVLIVLGIAGYFVYEKFFTKEEPKQEDKTPAKTEDKDVGLKDDSREVVYASIDEKHDGVVRRIPYVNINSKYADEINEELENLTKNGYLEGQVVSDYLQYKVDYQYYVEGDIVSIKFTWETEAGLSVNKIYNINKKTGEKVSEDEMLSQLGITKEDFNNKLVESYKVARPLESIENNQDAVIKECYQKDLDAFTAGTIKGMYLNNNELYVLFDLHYPAGSGLGEAILNVTASKVIMNPLTME